MADPVTYDVDENGEKQIGSCHGFRFYPKISDDVRALLRDKPLQERVKFGDCMCTNEEDIQGVLLGFKPIALTPWDARAPIEFYPIQKTIDEAKLAPGIGFIESNIENTCFILWYRDSKENENLVKYLNALYLDLVFGAYVKLPENIRTYIEDAMFQGLCYGYDRAHIMSWTFSMVEDGMKHMTPQQQYMMFKTCMNNAKAKVERVSNKEEKYIPHTIPITAIV